MAGVSGGDKADAYLRELSRKIEAGAVLRVGFLEGATYPDGTSVALVAAVQNFGAPSRGIPPRPFFSRVVTDKSSGWGNALAANMQLTQNDTHKSLERVGEGIAGQIRRSIVDTNAPPLSPVTIARKGFEKPLVDTGHMLNSVAYDVKVQAGTQRFIFDVGSGRYGPQGSPS